MHDPELPNDSIADAIADKQDIDWQQAERANGESGRDLIQQFKIISAIAAAAPRARPTPEWGASTPRPLLLAYVAMLSLAALEAVVSILLAIVLLVSRDGRSIPWPALLNVVLFGFTGMLLLVGGAKDRRVQLLGALFVFMASAFADPLSRGTGDGWLSWACSMIRMAPPESFFALALWLFASRFPRPPTRDAERLLSSTFVAVSAGLGVVLFLCNVALAAQRSGVVQGVGWIVLVDRHAPTLAFWPLLLGVAVPAIPYLVWKSRFEAIEEKRRVSWFVAGLGAGIAPTLLIVIAAPLVPSLADPAWQQWVGVFLYVSLASVIPMTVYAVAVHRVMDVPLFVRRTMQYALARYAIWALSLGPLGYLFVQMYLHRDLTVTRFLGQGRIIALLILALLGFAALIFRQQLLTRVDRWFLREPVDSAEALARLDRGFRTAQSIREITGILTQEVDRAVHPTAIAVLIVNDDLSQLVSLSDRVRPLSNRSALVDLLCSARTEIQVDVRADGPVTRLLPAFDREWLLQGGFQLLSPFIGSNGTLLGVLALGESRSELPYTKADRMLIAAMSGHAAMRLENQRVWELPLRGQLTPVDWQNEPGACCSACSRVWPSATTVCSCGARTDPAALPLVVHGKFRVERRIGAGGMGVVYLAVDIALDRRVAIKTLPALTAARAASMQREARAMASVLHPNLAMIFGVENWRGIPLLVVEYLEGGTLADRLRKGRLSIPSALDLGLVLADALDRVHASGILHRDIKPSNIGFTREGLVKLLDFGLAAMLDRSSQMEAGAELADSQVQTLSDADESAMTTAMASTTQIAGTPLYLSPEAIRGQPAQPSFDLWSLSLVLYEAVAGTLPFAEMSATELLAVNPAYSIPDVREYRLDCPPDVANFFASTLAPDPAQRPPSAGELRNLLQRLRADLNRPAT